MKPSRYPSPPNRGVCTEICSCTCASACVVPFGTYLGGPSLQSLVQCEGQGNDGRGRFHLHSIMCGYRRATFHPVEMVCGRSFAGLGKAPGVWSHDSTGLGNQALRIRLPAGRTPCSRIEAEGTRSHPELLELLPMPPLPLSLRLL